MTKNDDLSKDKTEKSPFDDFYFWLQLACIDFTFGFEETKMKETDAQCGESNETIPTGFNTTNVI